MYLNPFKSEVRYVSYLILIALVLLLVPGEGSKASYDNGLSLVWVPNPLAKLAISTVQRVLGNLTSPKPPVS
jgi:hypothetical protein